MTEITLVRSICELLCPGVPFEEAFAQLVIDGLKLERERPSETK